MTLKKDRKKREEGKEIRKIALFVIALLLLVGTMVPGCEDASEKAPETTPTPSVTEIPPDLDVFPPEDASEKAPETTPTPSVTEIPPDLDVFPPEVDGLTVTVNGVVASGTPGSTITRIHWDWGDGNSEDHSFPASHVYVAYGEYTITVTAHQTDDLTTNKTFSTGLIEIESYQNGDQVVALLVDPLLVAGIRLNLNQFEADLSQEGYIVIERASNFDTPPEVRSYLSELYTQTGQRLVGAILIGNIPHAYQWFTMTYANPDIPPTSEEVISFQYYADLNGTFSTSPGYNSPGGHQYSYDIHAGDMDWEIWIGVLPYYKGNLDETVAVLNLYFAKNHAYRLGEYNLPRCFLQVNEYHTAETLTQHTQILNNMRSGQYAWIPFSDTPDARLYFDSAFGNLSIDQGYADLRQGLADFTVLDAHGNWNASGKLDIATVESEAVKTVFLWSNGCAVGNLDHADNFLTSVVYSPTSMVLVAKGTTNDSGGMGNNKNGFFGHNISTALSQGESFGQAILSHINVPLIYPWSSSRELHFATVVIMGDPTLKLTPPTTLTPTEFVFDLNLSVSPPRSGTISHSSGTYSSGTILHLTATPASDYRFISWSGDVPDGLKLSPDIRIPMDQDREITANFELILIPGTTISLKSPLHNERFVCGETVLFEAAVTCEFRCSGSELQWTSDLDGYLGNGKVVSTSGLSVGRHIITVSGYGGLETFPIRVFTHLGDLYRAAPTEGEIQRILNDFDFTWLNGTGIDENWSKYDTFNFDQNSGDPSKVVIIAKLDLMRHQCFEKSLPMTNGKTIYDHFLTYVRNIELRLDCGYCAAGGDRVTLPRGYSHWDGRPSGGDNCKTPTIPILVYPYIYSLQCVVHEGRHCEPDDPGHTNCGQEGEDYSKDSQLEGGSGYAWAALYMMWVYKFSLYDPPDIKDLAGSQAADFLRTRFCSIPSHSDPEIQAIINELLQKY